MTIAEALNAAVQHHKAGDFARAEQLYRQVLAADPRQVDALHLRGLALHQAGHSEPAVQSLREALRLKTNFPEAHYNLGNILRDLHKPAEAAACYQQAIRQRPDYPEAHYNLGNCLLDLRQLAMAADSYRQAIRLRPNYTKALNNLGNTCMDLGRHEEAFDAYQQTLRLNPDYPKGHNNLGNALRQLGRLDESVASCRRALELEPKNSEAWNNLAAAQLDQNKIDDALTSFAQALCIRPDYAEAHMNRGMAWLLMGDYQRGWPEYEWRWKSKAFTPRGFTQPQWDGAPHVGRTILIHAEQGLGDTLQFVRYVPLVYESGGRVLLECPAALHKLLATVPGIEQLLAPNTALPPFDVHAPLLSLPHLLGRSEPDQGPTAAYLQPSSELLAQWRSELASIDGFKVGINWQGNPQHTRDRQRSMPLAQFLPLAEVPGVRLISLQKGAGSEQLGELPDPNAVLDLGTRLDETAGAFMDTAAVLKSLDLVITSDTALCHLAGALGVPVWVALSASPDWRWRLDKSDTPWYPTMRLFRQTELGQWNPVFQQIAAELQRTVAERTMAG